MSLFLGFFFFFLNGNCGKLQLKGHIKAVKEQCGGALMLYKVLSFASQNPGIMLILSLYFSWLACCELCAALIWV